MTTSRCSPTTATSTTRMFRWSSAGPCSPMTGDCNHCTVDIAAMQCTVGIQPRICQDESVSDLDPAEVRHPLRHGGLHGHLHWHLRVHPRTHLPPEVGHGSRLTYLVAVYNFLVDISIFHIYPGLPLCSAPRWLLQLAPLDKYYIS